MIEDNDTSFMFSAFYLVGGILMLGFIYQYSAHLHILHGTKWYKFRSERLLYLKSYSQLDDPGFNGFLQGIQLFLHDNKSAVITWILFLIWFTFGVLLQMLWEKNSFCKSFYITMSILSSTGSMGPTTNSQNEYAITFSFYNIIGVILLTLSFVYFNYEIGSYYLNARLQKYFKISLGLNEIQGLKEIGIVQGDTRSISKQEYIIGMALRLELLHPLLVDQMSQEYDKRSGSKTVSREGDGTESPTTGSQLSEYSRLIS